MDMKLAVVVLFGLMFIIGGQEISRGRSRFCNGVPCWCSPSVTDIRCFVNPCTVDRCPAYPTARCINDNPCNRACFGNFYLDGRRLTTQQCQGRAGGK